MEKESSFKSYSKVDDQEDHAFRRKTRKRLTIIVVSTFILLIVTIGSLIGIIVPIINSNKSKDGNSSSSTNQSIKAMCNVTRYPDSCYSSMSSALKTSSNHTNAIPNPQELFVLSLKVALSETTKLSPLPQSFISSNKNEINDPLVQSELSACETLFLDASDQINESITSMQAGDEDRPLLLNSNVISDIRTWLSAAITDLNTCIQGLQETEKNLTITDEIIHAMKNSTEYTSNSLAIATNVMTILVELQTPMPRKLLGHDQHLDDTFPMWVHGKDRKLLSEENIKANVTVAKDGSGDFKSIKEAVRLIPKKSKSRFIIHVKKGVYLENATIHKDQWNVMIYGDGMNKTIITCSLNKVDGVSTFFSGTFIAGGKGFIAKDVGFKNTAGPQKEQAVAVRSSSDKSVFYRCSFDAYQDTLYTHTNRQFYKDCQITGTIDFIFGNAAVVFQNCTIQPRQPLEKQFNTITAQSKSDPNENTGISIQRCKLIPFDDLTAQTFLGRPWREYATTVVMQSYMGEFLDPLGWTPWEPNGEFPPTIFYGEYENVGPGSGVKGRVERSGVFTNITVDMAEQFTVDAFIHGNEWLPQAGIAYDASL